jgi:hypothetical protein
MEKYTVRQGGTDRQMEGEHTNRLNRQTNRWKTYSQIDGSRQADRWRILPSDR